MRFHRAMKTLSAIAVAIGVGLVVVASASADSGEVKFRGSAAVVQVGIAPGSPPPASVFEVGKNGRIKQVSIHTEGEVVVAAGLEAECRRGPEADALCAALNGSALFSIHTSDASLISPELISVPNPFGGPPLEALKGRLKGSLSGLFLVTPDGNPNNATMSGGATLIIHGEGVYACFIGPMVACQNAGFGLGAVFIDVKDQGEFTIDQGIAGTYLVSNGSGKVTVEATLLDPMKGAATGSVKIREATATLTPL